MRRKGRLYFEAGGLAPGELSGKLPQFGYGTRAPEAVSLRVVYYDTQDGSLHRRGATLRFSAESSGDGGWWLIEQKDAVLEWVIDAGVASPGPVSGGLSAVGGTFAGGLRGEGERRVPARGAPPSRVRPRDFDADPPDGGDPFAAKLRALAGEKTLIPVLRADVAGERFAVTAPAGVSAELSCLRWVFSPPFAADREGASGAGPSDFVELSEPSFADGGVAVNALEFSYLAILLRDLMGFKPCEREPLVRGLEALGRPLPGAPLPEKFAVRVEDSLQTAVCKVLGAQTFKMRANTEGTLLDLDPEFLHDLRVATRRARFALKLARLFAGRAVCDALRSELAWVSDALGPVRDLDVLLQVTDNHFERIEATAGSREVVRGLLAERRSRAFANLKMMLESERYVAAVEPLCSLTNREPEEKGAPSPSARETPVRDTPAGEALFRETPPRDALSRATPALARDAAPSLVLKALRRVRKTAKGETRGGAAPPGKPGGPGEPRARGPADGPIAKRPLAGDFDPSTLHALRIAFKGLRYTCEFFLPVLGEDMRKAVKTVVAFQDSLGRYQDAVTAAGLFKEMFAAALGGGAGKGHPGGEAGRGPTGDEPALDVETLLAFGALIQVHRNAALAEMERFSKSWKSFKKLDRKLRRLLDVENRV
jgi:CHAD domain-containing protein